MGEGVTVGLQLCYENRPPGSCEALPGGCTLLDDFGGDDAGLLVVLAFTIFVGGLALVRGDEEQNLRDAFVGIYLGGQGGGVADFERDEALPLRLERGDVHDETAAGIGGLADTDRQHIARNAEVLDRTGQDE
jgi:hypothetical protein